MEMQRRHLEEMLMDPQSPVYMHTLLDFMTAVVLELTRDKLCKINIESFLDRYDIDLKNLMKLQLKRANFAKIKEIGQGRFGDVYLVKDKGSRKLYAMKVFKKASMGLSENLCYLNERNAMILANSPWLLQLHCAFQDMENLYLVMDYVPGGALENHLNKIRLSEEEAKFYAAELLLAVNAFHSMDYNHCGVYLSNILLDAEGHIVLIDYSMCSKTSSVVPVQNPSKNVNIGKVLDWYAAGMCINLMLMGVEMSDEAHDLLSFMCKRNNSITFDQIKEHPWFQNEQWTFDTIRSVTPPIVPEIESYTVGISETITYVDGNLGKKPEWSEIQFVGFTYFKENRLLSFPKQLPSIRAEESMNCSVSSLLYQETIQESIHFSDYSLLNQDPSQESVDFSDFSLPNHEPNQDRLTAQLYSEEKEDADEINKKLQDTICALQAYASALEREKLQCTSRDNTEKQQLEEELTRTKEEMTNMKNAMQREKAELEAKLNEERAAHLSAVESEKLKVYTEKQELERKLAQMKREMSNIESALKDEIEVLEAKLKEERAAKEDLQKRLNEMKKISNSYLSALQSKKLQVISKAHSEKRQLRQELTTVKKKMGNMKSSMQKERAELVARLEKERAANEDLQKCLKEDKTTNDCGDKKRAHLSALEGEKLQGISKAHTEKQQLKEELTGVREEMTNTKSAVHPERAELEARLDEERAAKKDLQKHLKEIKSTSGCGDSNKELENLKKSFSQMKTSCENQQECEKMPKSQSEGCHVYGTKRRTKKKQKGKLKTKISHANEDDHRNLQEQQTSPVGKESGYIYYKGHEFFLHTYRTPKKCEHCSKLLWEFFKPYQALKCQRCHIRCHKHHMDDNKDAITLCTAIHVKTAANMVQKNQQEKKETDSNNKKRLTQSRRPQMF